LFLKLIQCARGVIEAARSDLKEGQSEEGAFAGRLAFHGATKRLERLVRPAQSVERDSVIVPYPRILGSDFQCPLVLLARFLKPVERQQNVAAMMQRGHVPGIQRDTAINVAQSFRELPLFVAGDGTKEKIARKGRKLCPEPVGQGNRGHQSHACRQAKRPAPAAAADRFDEGRQAAAADGRHDRPDRIAVAITDEEGDIGRGIKRGINQQHKKRVAISPFAGRPDSGGGQHEQYDPAHRKQAQPCIFRLQKGESLVVGHFRVPKHQPAFLGHQPEPRDRSRLDLGDGAAGPIFGNGHGICIRLAALRAHRRRVFLARPHFPRILIALAVSDAAFLFRLHPVRRALVAQIKVHAAGAWHDLEMVRLHLIDKTPGDGHSHPADQPQ